MATLTKRAGSRRPWQVRYRDHTGTQRSEQFTRRADAEARKLEVERARQTGRLDVLDAKHRTLRDLGADFFKVRKGEWSPATTTSLAYIWNAHVHDHEIATLPVGSLRPTTIDGFKTDLRDAGVGDGSIRKALGLVSQVLDRAALDGIIGANPCAPVKRPSGARAGDVNIIPPHGVEAIRTAIASLDRKGSTAERKREGQRDAAVVSVMAYAGLRPEELRALTWAHVQAKMIRVEFACNPDGTRKTLKGTGGKPRSVPLCSALDSDLAALRNGAPDDALVFPRGDGGPWTKTDYDNWRKRRFLPAAKAAGVRIDRPYELRHSIASMWLREGHDAVLVARWLGHSPLVLFTTYSHVMDELDAEDRRSVDELIAAARNGLR